MKAIEPRWRERGVSIVELMVAITIGLILTLVIGSVFVASTKTFRTQDDASRLQETSRAALDVLGYHIHLAGYVDISDDPTRTAVLVNPVNLPWLRKTDVDPAHPTVSTHTVDMLNKFFGPAGSPYAGIKGIGGCDGPPGSTTSLALPWTCSAGSGPDSVTVAYQAQPSVAGGYTVPGAISPQSALGAYNSATGQGGDCAAKDVNAGAATPKGPLAINRFYIDSVNKRLMCLGNGDPTLPQPIAEGVEYMRIRYGVMPSTVSGTAMDSTAARYVKAGDVPDWSRVLSVRICLQIASPTSKVASNITSYTDCDGATQSQSDGKIRRTFTAVYSLRNNVLTNPDSL